MIDLSGLRNQNAQAKVFKTQKEIAELAGIDHQRYSKILRGKAIPTLKDIANLCNVFSCNVQDLVQFRSDTK